MSASPRNCGNCGHGQPVPVALGQLIECHGAPPQLLVGGQGIVSIWPGVRPDWWCGQWTAKPQQIFPAPGTETTEKPTGETHGQT